MAQLLDRLTSARKGTKSARIALNVTPEQAAEWKNFCRSINISMNAAAGAAMDLLMQSVEAERRNSKPDSTAIEEKTEKTLA